MSTHAKSRVAVFVCLLFVVWPAVHRVVVAIYETNAWRLGGFAMYATPPAKTAITVVEKRGGQQTIVPESDLPAALLEHRRSYGIRRSVLGLLLPPDDLAAAYFRARPDADRIEVMITREMLSASTARIERRQSSYQFDQIRIGSRKTSSLSVEVLFPE